MHRGNRSQYPGDFFSSSAGAKNLSGLMVECAKDPRPVQTTYFNGLRKAGCSSRSKSTDLNQTDSTVPWRSAWGPGCVKRPPHDMVLLGFAGGLDEAFH